MQFKLALPRTLARAGWDELEGRPDVTAVPFDNAIAPADLRTLLKDIDGIALGLTPFGAEEVAAAPRLKAVARIGVGYDTVDVPALTAAGVPLLITGIANSVSVAEQALFFMLALAKRGAELDRMVREHRWSARFETLPDDVFEKTVLVLGFGRIGSRFARRCQALEMRVRVFDPFLATADIRAAGFEPVDDLDAALPEADFVSIHCPKSPATIGYFDAARLGRMKPSAHLINTARGGIVDESALYEALTSGRLAGAGLDVLDREPPNADNRLLSLPNIVFAPHMAGVSRQAFDRMATATVRNLLDCLNGEPRRDHVVNVEVLPLRR